MDQGSGAEIRTAEPTGVFSFEGRITPRRFVLLTLAPYAFMLLAGIVSRGQTRTGGAVGTFFTVFGTLAATWITFATHVKRWHDLGKSGLRALLQLFPLVNIIAWLYLAFTKGQEGPNDYGDPPED